MTQQAFRQNTIFLCLSDISYFILFFIYNFSNDFSKEKTYKIQNLPMQISFNILIEDKKGSCSIYDVKVTTELEMLTKCVPFVIMSHILGL